MAECNQTKPPPRRIRTSALGHKQPKRSWFKPGNTVGFKKGQSGNPGGKPKQIREVEELARTHSLEAIDRLFELVQKSAPNPRVQLAAIEAMLDRALGKPGPAPPEMKDLPSDPVERLIVYPDGRRESVPAILREEGE